MKFSIDMLDWHGAGGWAFAPGGRVAIEVWSEDACVARVTPDRLRKDVAALHPDLSGIDVSGFRAAYTLRPEAKALEVIVVVSEIDAEGRPCGERREAARKAVLNPAYVARAFAEAEGAEVGPFPRGVEAAVRRLWPGAPPTRDEAGQRLHVEMLKAVAPSLASQSAPIPALVNYLRFLRLTWAHFRFVDRYFPAFNPGKTVDDTDWRGRPNSPGELFSIAHHLYVLRSYGVAGDFAEFGCFKGFSTSMLSFACGLLGVKMHVFDSFAGLPPSASRHYRAGEFRGSLDDVTRNVAAFGAPGAVEFHPGFFADSVPRDLPRLPALMAVWMDVDLHSSAQDVMPALDRLDARGALFSHECTAGHFDGGDIRPLGLGSDNVVPAIAARYAGAGVALTGAYVGGSTGAFWARGAGVPVLANACLLELANAA